MSKSKDCTEVDIMEEVKKADDVMPSGVKLHKHQDTGEYQDPRHGTTGCPVGPKGPEGATGLRMNNSTFSAPEDNVLSKEDRLEAENLNLKLMLVAARKDAVLNEIQIKLSKLDAEFKELQTSAEGLQHRLRDKYGIDFQIQMIEPGTGKIIPRK